MKSLIMILVCMVTANGLSKFAFAVQADISLTGKEIIERLARLEEGQKTLNKRIDDQGKRIDDLREELKGYIEGFRNELKGDIAELRNIVYIVLAGIIALIGFVIWDRRTALSPVINKTRELDYKNDLTLRALKEYARKEPRMAEILKSLGIL